jgi:uncharacterized membrane protein
MSKFVVVVFPDEKKAYEGTSALKQLHAEGSITVYASGVVAKEADGKISVKDPVESGPLSFGVGALIGGLVGLLGGPVGAAVGLSAGALIGGIADISNAGVQADFLEAVWRKLTPSKFAVVAEIAEDWVTPLDTRMEALGGEVMREWRSDFEDAQIEKAIKEREAEVAQLEEEAKRASQERKAKLKARIDEARAKLDAAVKRGQDRVHKLQQETEAKIKELEQQVAKAQGDAKAKIEQRIAAIRADQQRRTALLKQAWELTKKAFAA